VEVFEREGEISERWKRNVAETKEGVIKFASVLGCFPGGPRGGAFCLLNR
jgi:hypothetical protein